MLWILFFLSQSPARAENPHLPAEMQQKYEDVSAALRESYAETQKKLHKAEKNSDLVHSVTSGIAELWAKAKAKSFRAIVYLDHQLHEHVIGPDSSR